MEGIYTRFDIFSQKDGRARIRTETNDGDDDGVPGSVTVWENETTMKTALDIAGHKSHTGGYGQPVDVYIDGKKT